VVGLVMRISSTAFFTKYNMAYGDEKVLWWMDRTSLILTCGFVGQLFGALLTPSLLKFFDKKRLMIFMNLVFGVSILATYFIPIDQYLPTLIAYGIGIFAFGIIITLLFSMYTDCAEYGEWLSGHNSAGLTVSASLFALKFGSAVGSAIPGYLLGWYGFMKDAEQTATTLEGINISWNIAPAIFFFLATGLMFWYKLDKKTMDVVERDLLERRGEVA
jgi:GPH family glycoside/pentoside/hexuronide:cation symporter